MNDRSIAYLLLAVPVFIVSIASANEKATCPAGEGGEAALTTIGNRSFAPYGGRLSETGVTQYCLGCHDGFASMAVLAGKSGLAGTAVGLFGSTVSSFDRGSEHPVDFSYPQTRRGYHPASEVERSLPLAGGMVTCETCHSGNSSTPFRLTISNEGSRLCLTCHEK